MQSISCHRYEYCFSIADTSWNSVMQVLMACLRQRTTIEPWLAHLQELVQALKSHLVVSVIFFSLETCLLQQEIKMTKLLYWQSGLTVIMLVLTGLFSFLSRPQQRSHVSWSCLVSENGVTIIIFWWLEIASVARDNFRLPLASITVKAEHNYLFCLFRAKMVIDQVNFLGYASVSESQLLIWFLAVEQRIRYCAKL